MCVPSKLADTWWPWGAGTKSLLFLKTFMYHQRLCIYIFFRVRFPDGWLLQGTFAVQEELSAVSEFVSEHLETPLPHVLAPPRRRPGRRACLPGRAAVHYCPRRKGILSYSCGTPCFQRPAQTCLAHIAGTCLVRDGTWAAETGRQVRFCERRNGSTLRSWSCGFGTEAQS